MCITFDDGYADNCCAALPLLIEQGIHYGIPLLLLRLKESRSSMTCGWATGVSSPTRSINCELSRREIEIGFHTSYPCRIRLIGESDRLIDEIVTARNELEAALGQRLRYFAFPFGALEDLSVEAFELVRAACYEGVCSGFGGWNCPETIPSTFGVTAPTECLAWPRTD